jgi:hypothetical protein
MSQAKTTLNPCHGSMVLLELDRMGLPSKFGC